jgi:hypothetical protein
MIKWLRWHEYMMDWLTPKFESIVGAVAGPIIGGIFGGGQESSPSQSQTAPYKFTPYNVTTPFGGATFDTKKQTAGYTLSPELQAFRNQYYQAAQAAMPSPEQTAFANQVGDYGLGLFNQAANLDTGRMTTDYYNQQQNLLAPGRAQEASQLADTLFKTGRTGAGAGMTNTAGQTGYVNPEQFSLLSAREAQNAQLLMGAEDRARAIQNAQLANGLNYYGQGQALRLQPYNNANSLLGFGTGLEALGSNALTIGSNIGTGSANAAVQAGQLGMQQLNLQNQQNAQQGALFSGIASNIGNAIGRTPGNNPFDFGGWGSGLGSGGVSMNAGNYSIDQNPYLNWGS